MYMYTASQTYMYIVHGFTAIQCRVCPGIHSSTKNNNTINHLRSLTYILLKLPYLLWNSALTVFLFPAKNILLKPDYMWSTRTLYIHVYVSQLHVHVHVHTYMYMYVEKKTNEYTMYMYMIIYTRIVYWFVLTKLYMYINSFVHCAILSVHVLWWENLVACSLGKF